MEEPQDREGRLIERDDQVRMTFTINAAPEVMAALMGLNWDAEQGCFEPADGYEWEDVDPGDPDYNEEYCTRRVVRCRPGEGDDR